MFFRKNLVRSVPNPLQKFIVNFRNQMTFKRPFYARYYVLQGNPKENFVDRNTEIVIEGFPRSANTFSYRAFFFAQKRKISIAHHVHIPAQIITGVKLGIPTLVLIRNPEDTIISHLLLSSLLTPLISFEMYIHFYKTILPYKQNFVVGEFNTVISDFKQIIMKVNEKFSTNFRLFEHSRKNALEIFSSIDKTNKEREQGSINILARPKKEKESLKKKVGLLLQLPENQKLLKRAIKIYNEIIR